MQRILTLSFLVLLAAGLARTALADTIPCPVCSDPTITAYYLCGQGEPPHWFTRVATSPTVDFPMLEAAGSAQGYLVHTHWPIYVIDRMGVVRAVMDWSPESVGAELPKVVSSLPER